MIEYTKMRLCKYTYRMQTVHYASKTCLGMGPNMRTLVIIVLTLATVTNGQSAYGTAGRIFPIPLTESVEDPHFPDCPDDDGFYAHRTNCSLFHACSDHMDRIYSCIDGFFYNPHQGQCQYVTTDDEMRCEDILERMPTSRALPTVDVISDMHGFIDHHRMSAASECVRPGVYPDRLDCALFHYCRGNLLHEVLRCPDEMHFDPKTLLCAAPELVDCQYEPIVRAEEDFDKYSAEVCQQHPLGTYLPVIHRADMYLVCAEDGRGILKQCEDGHIYHALTMACQKGYCSFDPALCQNDGECIDDSMMEKGFKCVCSEPYRGEYCESDTSRPTESDETTHIPPAEITYDSLESRTVDSNTNSDHLPQSEPTRSTNLEQRFASGIQTVFMIAVVIIGIVLAVSIIFGIVTLARVILHTPTDNLHQWKTLREESHI